MRHEDDIIDVSVELRGRISLDRERIEQDPVWRQCQLLASDDDSALSAYIEHYITRDRFLRDCPSTNGPGHLIPTSLELINHGDGNDGNDRNEEADQGGKVPGS